MRQLLSLVLVTTCISVVDAQDAKIRPGQQKMKDFSRFIGTWRSTNDQGEERTTTYKWINNKSYVELVADDYREIIGWDLTDKKFVSWGFGTHGGQGKVIWQREDENTWSRTSNWLDAWGNEALITGKVVLDGDEMQLTIKYGDNQPVTIKAKRLAE